MNDQSKIRQRLIADSGFTLNSAAAQESEGNIIGITPIKQPRGRKKAKKAAAEQVKGSESKEAY